MLETEPALARSNVAAFIRTICALMARVVMENQRHGLTFRHDHSPFSARGFLMGVDLALHEAERRAASGHGVFRAKATVHGFISTVLPFRARGMVGVRHTRPVSGLAVTFAALAGRGGHRAGGAVGNII